MATQPSELPQALIAFGGAIVGGFFVLIAGWKQGKRDQRQRIGDASRVSAKRILMALTELEGAVVECATSNQSTGVTSSFNSFSGIVISEAPFITDDEVAYRVRAHIELMYRFVGLLDKGSIFLLDTVRNHSAVVVESLAAHIANKRLPVYRPLPLGNVKDLAQWCP